MKGAEKLERKVGWNKKRRLEGRGQSREKGEGEIRE